MCPLTLSGASHLTLKEVDLGCSLVWIIRGLPGTNKTIKYIYIELRLILYVQICRCNKNFTQLRYIFFFSSCMYDNAVLIKIHITKPSLILSTGDLYVCTVNISYFLLQFGSVFWLPVLRLRCWRLTLLLHTPQMVEVQTGWFSVKVKQNCTWISDEILCSLRPKKINVWILKYCHFRQILPYW